ncbi:MAG: cysteine--tRNA ligase [Candidatus Aminicenantes bacterium]|nr:cysteine--tRNA ligase [Candidatus Aminicenantes bacterium]
MIAFHNTLTSRQEPFAPLRPGEVGLYTCGPTVYDFPHIGNFRAYVFEDLLKRFLRASGFRVLHVMNITDVDDKTIRGAEAKGVPLDEYTAPYIEAFFEGIRALRIVPADHYPRATRFIPEMVEIIQGLLEKGYAYGKDGSVYFRIARFPEYGKLSKIRPEDLQATARVEARLEADEYEKDSPRDFALWKAAKPGEPAWDTAIGRGRPGWHIECSAMSTNLLGPAFDIHCGGVDNIFPHHENEIAQSEAFFGHPFVGTWLHCHHLIVDGEKMSKSKGNQYTLRDLVGGRGLDPAVLRYFLLSTHYRRVLNFTFEAIDQSASALRRLRDFVYELEHRSLPPGRTGEAEPIAAEAQAKFLEGLGDDLNVSAALTALFELVRAGHGLLMDEKLAADDAASLVASVYSMDEVLAVLPPRGEEPLPEDLRGKVEERERARKARDWPLADRLRRELLEAGVVLEDTKDGVRWKIRARTGSG